ncbi:MAG: sigma-70 family RNA polymerase sigma factor [Bryobacteraceae bacterium]|nr:sigma-70 family RNA polymerase sigma factor [Bryobacteraceae bacterium]
MAVRTMDGEGDVTRLLESWRNGDPNAFEQLIPVAYDQLHAIAIGLMRRERTDHTLQPTALLNELYVRLLQQRKVAWEDREHFYTFAARLMRNILIDHARGRNAQRRGSDAVRIPIREDLGWFEGGDDDLLDVNRALEKLEAVDPRKAKLVELYYFLSFTVEEAAELLNVSRATTERDLKFARVWLYRELKKQKTAPPSGA